jgi:hypothetical protein
MTGEGRLVMGCTAYLIVALLVGLFYLGPSVRDLVRLTWRPR